MNQEKPCKKCGKLFYYGTRICCSRECEKLYDIQKEKQRKEQRPLRILVCKFCENKFESQNNPKFCSSSCRNKNRAKLSAERVFSRKQDNDTRESFGFFKNYLEKENRQAWGYFKEAKLRQTWDQKSYLTFPTMFLLTGAEKYYKELKPIIDERFNLVNSLLTSMKVEVEWDVPQGNQSKKNFPDWYSEQKGLRQAILERDEYVCLLCGRRPPEIVLQIAHIIPRCLNGKYLPSNLFTACSDCNQGMGMKILNPIPPQILSKINKPIVLAHEVYEKTFDAKRISDCRTTIKGW